MPYQVEREALKYASELLGSSAALAEKLDVPMEELNAWIDGTRELPDDKLLKLLDIILTATSGNQQK